MDGEPAVTCTTPPIGSGTNGLETSIRAGSLGLVAVVVLLAAAGLLGVRTSTVRATGNGYSIEVLHSVIARPGLAAPFSVEVSTVNGAALPETVKVRIDSSYLAMFDDNGMEPLPASSFNNSQWTWWSFEVPPDSNSLRVDLDARLEPAVQSGMDASAAIEIEGVEMIEALFTTWVMP